MNASELAALTEALKKLGCPQDKAADMAGQLAKRARQLAREKGRPYEEALAHLLSLMKEGWAGQQKS